ncbi:UNVERIFIED_CONTAM: NAP1-related protein 1 [Sesamum radiatum]|uniref:NAP1-related protein 1 n=1 Tax=Sesamum radiatum TaxID=300843 RepID=A0AAW2RBU2_SESRA
MVSNRAKKSRTAAAEADDQFERDDMLLAIEKLQEAESLRSCLSSCMVNEEANEKILEIEQKYNEMREPVYAKRNEVISSIPDFWLTAIFKYLDSLEVEDFKDPRKGYCITFGPADASNDSRKGNKRPLNLSSFFSWFGFPPEGTVEVEQDVEDDEDYTEDDVDDNDDRDEGDEDDNDEGDEDGCGNDDE